jgi:hypothetical protein
LVKLSLPGEKSQTSPELFQRKEVVLVVERLEWEVKDPNQARPD